MACSALLRTVLLVLVFFIHTSNAESTVSGYNIQRRKKCSGHDISTNCCSKSARQCGEWCDNTADCKGFMMQYGSASSWSNSKHYCYLKRNICSNPYWTAVVRNLHRRVSCKASTHPYVVEASIRIPSGQNQIFNCQFGYRTPNGSESFTQTCSTSYALSATPSCQEVPPYEGFMRVVGNLTLYADGEIVTEAVNYTTAFNISVPTVTSTVLAQVTNNGNGPTGFVFDLAGGWVGNMTTDESWKCTMEPFQADWLAPGFDCNSWNNTETHVLIQNRYSAFTWGQPEGVIRPDALWIALDGSVLTRDVDSDMTFTCCKQVL